MTWWQFALVYAVGSIFGGYTLYGHPLRTWRRWRRWRASDEGKPAE